MSTSEVYPGAPLVSVAFELRHPAAEPMTSAHRAMLQHLLGERFPLVRSHRNITQTVELGPSGPATRTTTEEFPRYLNRSRTSSVSFTSTSVLVETTDYQGWAEFRPLIELACQVRNAATPVYGVERVGLRYVDEVRAAEQHDPTWGDWVSESLLGAPLADASGLPLRVWQGALSYGSEPGQGLVLRYGPGNGYATEPTGEPRRRTVTAPGPFFLLDIDSFWAPESDVPAYDLDLVLAQADQLHEPVRTVFEASITNKYRDEVLRK